MLTKHLKFKAPQVIELQLVQQHLSFKKEIKKETSLIKLMGIHD
jgi:hypothetical protein